MNATLFQEIKRINDNYSAKRIKTFFKCA